jgi:adenylyl-sulfate kinase
VSDGVTQAEREARLGQRGLTVWFTGLSGAGKSTITQALERRLFAAGRQVTVLDGDVVRGGLNGDLGFSDADRSENLRRVAHVARIFNQAGLIVLAAFISPTREQRRFVRQVVGPDRFVLVHVATSLATCRERDPKGLYAKADAGEIPQFTGVSAPYEAPEAPDLALETEALSVDEAVDAVLAALEPRALL